MPRPEERLIEQPRPHEPDAFHEPHRPADGLNDRLERLPRSHPSSPFRDDGTRKPPPPDYRRAELPLPDEPGHHPGAPREGSRRLPDQHTAVEPLTDAEYTDHKREVRERLSRARDHGLRTYQQHTIDPDHEIWSQDRDALHDEIVASFMDQAVHVPSDRQAVVAGGLPGSGKSTILATHDGFENSRFLTIDPDAIKEEMAKKGMIPVVEGLSPMEASDLAHEESSHIAKLLAARAQAAGKNLIWDITMSERSSVEVRISSLRAAGYSRIDGVFVDIPLHISEARAEARHRFGHDEYRAGRGYGGRFVPGEVIQNRADDMWSSVNRRNFEETKHLLDHWSVYNNSVDARAPVVVDSGQREARAQ